MRGRDRHDLGRRLARLDWARPEHRGENMQWLTDGELQELRDLLEGGLPLEAPECRRLLAVGAWRRARGDPKAGERPRMSDEELEAWAAQVNAAIDERLRGGRLVPRGDGNFNWVRDR
jgi:hypothetical protein